VRERLFQWTFLLLLVGIVPGCERPALVIDEAALFDQDQIQRLEQFHSLLLTDHDIDYRVMTKSHVPDINEYSARLYTDMDVGSTSAYGLLLVIDDSGRRVRLEVGFGLEGYFPDAFVAYVESRQMLPFFAANRISDGILATTEFIVGRAQRHSLGEDGTGEVWKSGSGGGGATARLGQHTLPSRKSSAIKQTAGRSPHETLAQYFNAMAERNADQDLSIYIADTQTMLSDWVVTPAQMDNMVATYRKCEPQPAIYDAIGQLAVIRYPIEQRHCAPWFFSRNGELWQLDLTMMSQAVRFGRDNSWHFDVQFTHPYMFAFDDWRFDRSGFPVK
jgi:uncharacterized protein